MIQFLKNKITFLVKEHPLALTGFSIIIGLIIMNLTVGLTSAVFVFDKIDEVFVFLGIDQYVSVKNLLLLATGASLALLKNKKSEIHKD
ncbi:MAG: hypothetical protein B6D44_00110 [Ignavibacteriales bacterium UTCHB2]|jgi:hypothetical protein|nr:MAG: hypothetical protein B6D44_00110 [Ignavibacteriales bacterium UTCHB2]